jgi:hypothetical protein
MEMDLKALNDTPPWDWPAGTAERLVNVLRDEQATKSDRLLAAEMAGDFTVVSEELVDRHSPARVPISRALLRPD